MLGVRGRSPHAPPTRIPPVMGTQHPDNVSAVPFGTSPRVGRDLEGEKVLPNISVLDLPPGRGLLPPLPTPPPWGRGRAGSEIAGSTSPTFRRASRSSSVPYRIRSARYALPSSD